MATLEPKRSTMSTDRRSAASSSSGLEFDECLEEQSAELVNDAGFQMLGSDDEASEESGYVLPMTALLLIPLLIFAAFAVDVGAWYLKGQQVQRASDAAALAGVVHMPNLQQAEVVALDIAAKNGMVDQRWIDAGNPGVANANVIVSAKADQLRVRIDTDTPAYLGKIVLDEVDIERYSVADITSEVGFGNPTSGLGTGNLGPGVLGSPPGGGSYAHGLWLSINSHCIGYAQGDPFSPAWYSTGQPWNGCTDGARQASPGFKPAQDMYDYVVDIPHGITGNTAIQVFEPGVCRSGQAQDSSAGPRLQFRVYGSDATPDYDLDNLAQTPIFDEVYPRNACSGGQNGWYTMAVVPASEAGKWYVRANSRANFSGGEVGLNNFALRAVPHGGNGFLCSQSAANPTCPSLYAREWASFYRPSWGVGGATTEFFLAQIEDEHAGKTVQIRLFDPGEGMNNLQFFDDSDTAIPFRFRRSNCSVGNICENPGVWPEDPTFTDPSNCSGNPCLIVTNQRYNAQWVTLEYDLPADYTCSSSCWWKVRYTPEGANTPTDRTTWSVKVIGDPAHLTE